MQKQKKTSMSMICTSSLSIQRVIHISFFFFFYLLLNGVRGALHPPFLQRGFVLGVNHGSVGHQLQFIVLKRGFAGLKLFLSSEFSTYMFLLIHFQVMT